MINYIETISTYHADIGVSASDCCDYNSIDWNGNTPIAQAQLDVEWLGIYKTNAIISMSVLAQNDIVQTFESTALGGSPPYKYDSKFEDQLNLIGSASAGDDMDYPVRIDDVKTYLWHTHAELLQVVQDGRDVKLNVLQTFNTKKESILSATTEAEVDAVVW